MSSDRNLTVIDGEGSGPVSGEESARLALTAFRLGTHSAGRVRLDPWRRMEIEQTRKLLLDVPELLDTRPHAYLAGLLEGAAANLLDILDAITETGD